MSTSWEVDNETEVTKSDILWMQDITVPNNTK